MRPLRRLWSSRTSRALNQEVRKSRGGKRIRQADRQRSAESTATSSIAISPSSARVDAGPAARGGPQHPAAGDIRDQDMLNGSSDSRGGRGRGNGEEIQHGGVRQVRERGAGGVSAQVPASEDGGQRRCQRRFLMEPPPQRDQSGTCATRVAEAQGRKGITPRLSVILVGEDPASVTYTRMKKKACEAAGMISDLIELPRTAPRTGQGRNREAQRRPHRSRDHGPASGAEPPGRAGYSLHCCCRKRRRRHQRYEPGQTGAGHGRLHFLHAARAS